MKDQPQNPRTRYQTAIRNIVATLYQRNALSLCPYAKPDDDDRKAVATLNRDVAKGCAEMRTLETESGNAFGVQKLLGQDAENCIRCALSVMAASVVTPEVAFRDVAGLIELCCGHEYEPVGVTQVFRSFEPRGILRPHVKMRFRSSYANLAEVPFSLREVAFRTLTGTPAAGGEEFEEIDRVSALTGRS